jgi:hypothetical protein
LKTLWGRDPKIFEPLCNYYVLHYNFLLTLNTHPRLLPTSGRIPILSGSPHAAPVPRLTSSGLSFPTTVAAPSFLDVQRRHGRAREHLRPPPASISQHTRRRPPPTSRATSLRSLRPKHADASVRPRRSSAAATRDAPAAPARSSCLDLSQAGPTPTRRSQFSLSASFLLARHRRPQFLNRSIAAPFDGSPF